MNSREHESLSALMDNEVDDLELRRLLKSIDQDDSLLDTWQRYNLAQAVIHDEAVASVSPVFSQKVFAALDEESAYTGTTPVSGGLLSNWGQSLTKVAIAASFAFAVILLLQTGNNSNELDVAQDDASDAQSGEVILVAEDVSTDLDPAAQERLRDYIQGIADETEVVDETDPLEELEDSPLLHLVNEVEVNDQE